MNEEEARAEHDLRLLKFHEEQGKVLCPLLGYNCQETCVCIDKPTYWNTHGSTPAVQKNFPDDWKVGDWTCGNTMFTGERYEQNVNR